MEAQYLELSPLQVAVAAALILLNAVISIALRLRMEGSLVLASVRTVAQLVLLGMVLEYVFEARSWYLILSVLVIMTTVAGWSAAQRSHHRYPGIRWNALLAVWVSSWIVAAFALAAVLRGREDWLAPQYVIPLLGILLGNTLNGISLGLNTFLDTLVTRREEVEALLSVGATRWEASRGAVREAVRTGMIPIINSMMVVGLVSLPGMMTGQLLSGTSPSQAVKYQIVVMFLIASATALGTVAVVVLGHLALTNGDHQLLSHRILTAEERRRRRGEARS